MHVGKIAHKYLSDYAAKQNVDKTFGIYKNPLDNNNKQICKARNVGSWETNLRRRWYVT